MARSVKMNNENVCFRRQALQIAAQLPADPEQAKKILDYALEIIEWQAGNKEKAHISLVK